MIGRTRLSRWLFGAASVAAAFALPLGQPVQAQRYQSGGGFFGWFGGGGGYYNQRSYQSPFQQQQPAPQQIDSSRAPAPHKPDPNAPAPTTSIVVLGDGMADWLAYGLEDAFSDTPEVGIVRKDKINSGLLRYEPKGDLDWWHVARDILTQEKPNYVVMMLGISDRQNIRERDLVKEADKNAKEAKEAKDTKEQQDKKAGDQKEQTKDQSDEQDQDRIIATEPQHGANGVIEFRSDKWAEVYSKRIDETIAALKSKGVPVFWVGLPAIRGAKSTADASYLNDLYRTRAARAGINYIDVWDGFVDEGGKYSNFGPDYEGQTRRLRSNDGVYFTKSGARKLAHYVEREIRRYMSNKVPVAFPAGPAAPIPDAKSKVRPVAGPVVPLTVMPGNTDELVGGSVSQPLHSDNTADRVLVRGEPVPGPAGRADDFAWPPGSDAKAAVPAAAAAPEPNAIARTEPVAVVKPPQAPKSGGAKILQTTGVKPKLEQRAEKKTRSQGDAPRPPGDIPQSRGGWFR